MLSHIRLPAQLEHVLIARDCVCDSARVAGVAETDISMLSRHVADAAAEAVRQRSPDADDPWIVVSYGRVAASTFEVTLASVESDETYPLVKVPCKPKTERASTTSPVASDQLALPPLHKDPGAFTLQLSGNASRVPQSRKFVVAVLYSLGHDEAASVAELVVSELVTNTVIHTPGGAAVSIGVAGRRVRVEVSDTSDEAPRVLEPTDAAGVGRGLLMVQTLTSAWGHTRLAEGKAVWVELDGDSTD